MQPTRHISALSTIGRPVALAGRRVRKDVARVGTYHATSQDGSKVELDITPERMANWVKAHEQFTANGNRVDVTVDHQDRDQYSAHAVHGEVERLFVGRFDGDRLVEDPAGDVLGYDGPLADEESATLAERCPRVSLELEKDFQDGQGNRYDEVIGAVTICRHPVIGHQKPFQRIAASLNGDTAGATVLYFSADPQSNATSEPSNPNPNHGNTAMNIPLTAALIATIAGTTGVSLSEDSKPADVVSALSALEGKTLADPDALKSAEAIERERDTLKGQVESLEKAAKDGNAPEADEDALDMAANAVQTELNGLVKDAKLTPDAAQKLAASLVGTQGSRPAYMLSGKVAKHAGLPGPAARAILDALKDNNPVELGKQHSKAQVNFSSAPDHGGDGQDDDVLGKSMDALAAARK